MGDTKKNEPDTETILMALDQISQTIDVMTSVVGRLRNHLREQEKELVRDQAPEDDSSGDVPRRVSRTVH